MKKIGYLYLSLFVGLSIFLGEMFFVENLSFARNTQEDQNYLEGKYKISKIKKVKDSFKIVFTKDDRDKDKDKDNYKSLPKSIMIVTQYVHHVLEEGMSIKLSFRMEKNDGIRSSSIAPIELDQLLVYLPNDLGGVTPVWMVSKNKEFMGLNGSKFLKMHSPSNDFIIF